VSDRRFAHLEFQAAQSDPAAISAAVRGSGCALIRKALGSAALGYLGDVVPFLFNFIDLRETYAGFDAAEGVAPKRFVAPLLRFDVLPAYGALVEFDVIGPLLAEVDRSCLPRVTHAYFEGRPVLIDRPMCMARRQSPDQPSQALPFHQDGANYAEMQFLNFWIPLTRAGDDAPGLEVAPVALSACMALTTGPTEHPLIELDAAAVADKFDVDNFFRPVMSPGDVLVMNEYTIHRTHIPSSARRERHSIELRVMAAPAED